MDFGHTYATASTERVMLYCTDDLVAPDSLELTRADGTPVTFSRIDPVSIRCRDVAGVPGSCQNADCHRMPLGRCRCGRHGIGSEGETIPVSFSRAVSTQEGTK